MELIELGLLRETGRTTSPSGVGRPGLALELADVVVGVGLEVNVDYVAVSVEDLTGTVRYERRAYRDNRGSAPGPVLDRLARTARAAVDAAAREGLRPIGVSVAVPGLVEEASGTVVFAPNLGWENVRVGVELASRLELPVHVENESNLAALAEHWIGAAAGIDDFVCVFGEVGVGGGVVLGGRLFRGSHGFGGEFGHVSVDPDGASLRVREPRLRRDARRRGGDCARGRCLAVDGPFAEPHGRDRPPRRERHPPRPGGARRHRPLAGHRPRVDLQRARRPGRGAGWLLRAALSLARRRRPEDARGALTRGPVRHLRGALVGVRRRCRRARRRGALAPPGTRSALGCSQPWLGRRPGRACVRAESDAAREGGGDRSSLAGLDSFERPRRTE